jgi:Tfp pilus assembly protein PilF
MLACPTCNTVIARHDTHCSLCGGENPAFEPLPAELEARMHDGLSALQTADYATAIRTYEHITSLDPDIAEAYLHLTHCFSKLRLFAEAYKAMERAVALRPGSSLLHYNLGLTARGLGKPAEARAYLLRALELADTDPNLDQRADLKQRAEDLLRRLKPS